MRLAWLAFVACGHPAPTAEPSNVAHAPADAAIDAEPARTFPIRELKSSGNAIVIVVRAGMDDGYRRTSTAHLRAPDGHDLGPLVLVYMMESESAWQTTATLVELSHAAVEVRR